MYNVDKLEHVNSALVMRLIVVSCFQCLNAMLAEGKLGVDAFGALHPCEEVSYFFKGSTSALVH